MELKPFQISEDNIFEAPTPAATSRTDSDLELNPFHTRAKFDFDRPFFLALIGLFLLSSVIASGILREFTSSSTLLGAKRYAFVQVRAIDENGIAIPGAQVVIDSKPNGYTDSFGYWQRYMRVQLGGELSVKLSKNYSDKKIIGASHIKVAEAAPSKKAEIELKTSIILKPNVLTGQTTSSADVLASRP